MYLDQPQAVAAVVLVVASQFENGKDFRYRLDYLSDRDSYLADNPDNQANQGSQLQGPIRSFG